MLTRIGCSAEETERKGKKELSCNRRIGHHKSGWQHCTEGRSSTKCFHEFPQASARRKQTDSPWLTDSSQILLIKHLFLCNVTVLVPFFHFLKMSYGTRKMAVHRFWDIQIEGLRLCWGRMLFQTTWPCKPNRA